VIEVQPPAGVGAQRVCLDMNPFYTHQVIEQARRARLHDLAETGGSQHGGVAWRWVLVNPTVAWFTVQASRSHAAFEALVASWAELVVRDG
jgi:hypothetical protein